MLISDRRFTPLSTPATTLNVAIAVMIRISTILVVVVAGMPNRKFSPAVACSAPKPSEVASPKMVANTARMSMIWPGQPQMRSPRIG